jgi:hypothetical protein
MVFGPTGISGEIVEELAELGGQFRSGSQQS